MVCLFESSTCCKQLCAHPQENNCINTTSGIITLKINEWSKIAKITRITRIYRGCMQPRYILVILVILVILDHSFIFRVIIPDVVLIQLFSCGWAHSCSKHVEDSNKHIIEESVRQVDYLPELYEDVRSEKYRINSCWNVIYCGRIACLCSNLFWVLSAVRLS